MKKRARCTCLEEVNKKLLADDGNTVLDIALNSVGEVFVKIATVAQTPRRGFRRRLLVATFCPFCGEKYP